jgi:predicted GIY-YIG superfamily endonuclease
MQPAEREKIHNEGRGARYTALRCPVALVYSEGMTRLKRRVIESDN